MALFEGEQLVLSNDLFKPTVETADHKINEKYIKGEIRIVTEQARYPLNTISGILKTANYKLNPEYQRRHRWSNEHKSRLIESLIMNVPIPPIFLYEYEFSQYEVMDGLQRLTAINDFYTDHFQLVGLERWEELNGRTYSTLPDKVREGIDRRYLSSVILLKETAKNNEDAADLKKMVFERLNSGGVRLTHQESRNAIFNGPLNQLCLELSRNASLCRLWNIPLPDEAELSDQGPSKERLDNQMFREMADVELVLRFFAYRQKHDLHKGALSIYLDKFLQYGNSFSPELIEKLKALFETTIKLIEEIFGEKAFYIFRTRQGQNTNWFWFNRATIVIYDPLMAVISKHIDKAEKLRAAKDTLVAGLEGFYKTHYEAFEGRNVNPGALVEREKLLEDYVLSSIQ